MSKRLAVLLLTALPFAAGFVVSGAHAQGLQYSGPGAVTQSPTVAPMMNEPVVVGMPVTGNNTMTNVSSAPVGDMTRMAALEKQIAELTNQLEQRDFQLRQLQQNFDKYVADSNARFLSLEQRGTAAAAPTMGDTYSDAMAASETPPTPTPVQNTAQASTETPVTGGMTDPNGAFQPTTTPTLGQINETSPSNGNGGNITSGKSIGTAPANAAQAYDQAFAYLQQSNYTDAQTAFSNFLTTYPAHPLAANAQYWLGETYFAQTQYSMAAKTFAKAFQDHPQGQKAPDALLKLAMTLDKMNKKQDACLTLGELSKRFPAGPSSVLRRGQEESARLKCAS